eukprot:m.176723 g.176723  ORF g.176723 m.176723 type:complete len:307 (+) comp18363_c0_seq31:2460-3380(+)
MHGGSVCTNPVAGSLINAAVEDGRLLDADVHDLRCTYRQRAVAVHASTADGPRSSTASSAPVSVVSDNALQKPSDTQSEQVSAGQTHDRISADSSASTEISVSSSATKHHPSSHVRDATTSQPLSDDNLGVFLTEAMSVLSFEGIRSSVNSLRRKDGQGNAHIVATFVDAIAAADSLTALKFTGKQLKATATLLSEAELELLRRKYRERAEQVHSDGTASVSAKTPADVNGSSETPTSHGNVDVFRALNMRPIIAACHRAIGCRARCRRQRHDLFRSVALPVAGFERCQDVCCRRRCRRIPCRWSR